jgi:hypothetical protein
MVEPGHKGALALGERIRHDTPADLALAGLRSPDARKEAAQLLQEAAVMPNPLFPIVGMDGAVGQIAVRRDCKPSDEALALAGYAARLGWGFLGPVKTLELARGGRLIRSLHSTDPVPNLLRDFILRAP